MYTVLRHILWKFGYGGLSIVYIRRSATCYNITKMNRLLTLLIVAKNAGDIIGDCILSANGIADEIVIIDNGSIDNTAEICKRYNARVYTSNERNLGKLRKFALSKVKTSWILFLDSDEILSSRLSKEIYEAIRENKADCFYINFKNHLFGKPLSYGGERYRFIRLFKKGYVDVAPALVHESYTPNDNSRLSVLRSNINHYSYRSITQMYIKFHKYAMRKAEQKNINREKSSLKKMFLYAPHMFWSRYVKDRGYKDGAARILLDLGFAYMEFATYTKLALLNIDMRA